MLYSVCIPVYNAEKYLADSVASVLSQSYKDFEIVLVNDCSTDSSGRLCDELAERYPDKIRAYHNSENQGLLITRRIAFSYAKGEWLISVDADDTLLPDAISELDGVIRETGCDLVLYDLQCKHLDGRIEIFTADLPDGRVFEGKDRRIVFEQLIKNDYMNSVCTKAIHRSIFDADVDYAEWQGLRFGTDIFQSLPIMDASQKMIYLKKSLYEYVKRENAITTKWHERWYDIKKMLWERYDIYIDKWELDDAIVKRHYSTRIKSVVPYIDKLCQIKDRKGAVEYMNNIYADGYLATMRERADLSSLKSRYKLYYNCLVRGRSRTLYALSSAFGVALKVKRKIKKA